MAKYFSCFLTSTLLMCTVHIYCEGAERTEFTTEKGSKIPAKYNESCEFDDDCDVKLQLKCTSGICNCSNPDIMIIRKDTEGTKCYVKLGEKCNSAKGIFPSKSRRSPDEPFVLDCVPNSQCSTDGYCVCNYGTFQNDEGGCTPKGRYFQRCKFDSHCREDKGLYCNKFLERLKICDCDRNNSWTHNSYEERDCVIMAGHNPPAHLSNVECVTNAHYNETSRKCECNPEFIQSKWGDCFPTFGGKCYPDRQPCSPELTCVDGRCECPFSGSNHVNGTCYSKAGQPCMLKKYSMGRRFWNDPDLHNISLPCTSNAVCSPRKDNSQVYECQCRSGYVDVGGKCQLDHGMYCGRGTVVETCDQNRGFQCIQEICQCSRGKLQYFDEKLKLCRGMVGAACTIASGNDTAQFCTPGALCVPSKGVRGAWHQAGSTSQGGGRCTCMADYRLHDNRTCTPMNDNHETTTTI